ncbi:hypothetical protein V8D89_012112 [Ganoderma adspersum]
MPPFCVYSFGRVYLALLACLSRLHYTCSSSSLPVLSKWTDDTGSMACELRRMPTASSEYFRHCREAKNQKRDREMKARGSGRGASGCCRFSGSGVIANTDLYVTDDKSTNDDKSDDNGKSLKYDMVPNWSEPAIKTDPPLHSRVFRCTGLGQSTWELKISEYTLLKLVQLYIDTIFSERPHTLSKKDIIYHWKAPYAPIALATELQRTDPDLPLEQRTEEGLNGCMHDTTKPGGEAMFGKPNTVDLRAGRWSQLSRHTRLDQHERCPGTTRIVLNPNRLAVPLLFNTMARQSETGKKKKKKASHPSDSDKEDRQPPAPKPPKLKSIDWTANNSHLLWQLLSEAEKEPNCKVLFGKKSDQNSSAEHKTAAHRRIAAVVIPDLHAINSSIAGDRVKGRISS